MAADSYIIVSAQNLLGLQMQINAKIDVGYQPLSGSTLVVGGTYYQGMYYNLGQPVQASNIVGFSTLFKQLMTISDKELFRQAVGGLFIGTSAGTAKEGNWLPTADDIKVSDMVKALLKTSTAAGMRQLMGSGTSNLVIGTGADEAKRGDYQPTLDDITGVPEIQQQIFSAASAEAIRLIIGAGSSNLKVGVSGTDAKPGNWKPAVSDLQNVSGIIASLLSSVDAQTARSAIGAGTSSLTVGTDSTQAKPGNWRPAVSDISDVQLSAVQSLLRSTGTAMSSADRAALKQMTGFGSSDLQLGTTSTTAKQGDWLPGVADIKDITSSAVQAMLRYAGSDLTSAQQLALRNIMGAGTSSLAIGATATTAKPGNYAPSVDELTNASDIGKAIVKAATFAAAIQAITGNVPQTGKFLRADGTWQDPAGTTYQPATTTASGLMSAADKQRLDNISTPVATAIAANGRPVDTAFTIDSARWADVTYSFTATLSATIAANQNVAITATVDGAPVAILALGITLSLAVTVGMSLPFTHSMTFRVPPGKQVKFNKTGTAAVVVSVACGQETLL